MPPLAFAALALWLVAVGAGWAAMTSYEFQIAEASPDARPLWPETEVQRAPRRPALVVCLHPKCPCSQATLSELERLLARPAVAASRPMVVAVLAIPADADGSWKNTSLVERCRRLPATQVVFDRGGTIAARFGAVASGEVLLFDSAGQRQFAGGVTASRGHEGESIGVDALAAFLAGMPSATASTPVFGCRLVAPPKDAEQATMAITETSPAAGVAPWWVLKITSVGALVPSPSTTSTASE